jgi:hypothetical protein
VGKRVSGVGYLSVLALFHVIVASSTAASSPSTLILTLQPSAWPDALPEASSAEAAADCIAALELLQWKHDADSAASLVPALCAVLRRLLHESKPAQSSGGENSAGENNAPAETGGVREDDADEDAEDAEQAVGFPASYVAQLALDALRGILERHAGDKTLEVLTLVTPTIQLYWDGLSADVNWQPMLMMYSTFTPISARHNVVSKWKLPYLVCCAQE